VPTRRHPHQTPKKKAGKRKEPFDYVIYFFTIATPLFELPQAYAIYSSHSAGSVSLASWSFFLLDNIVWIIYAARHRMKPLLVTSILYLIIESVVVVGIIIYS